MCVQVRDPDHGGPGHAVRILRRAGTTPPLRFALFFFSVRPPFHPTDHPTAPHVHVTQWDGEMDDIIAEAGEALTVGDAKEAWIFHILPDDTGACEREGG